jgi:hypothetical protein
MNGESPRKRREESGKNVQRNLKKKLTPVTRFATVTPHTEHTNTKHMRTKTLLLTAALSAAGIASSMAQVYSINIVGYVNLTMKPGFNLVANPLTAGTPANSLNAVLPAAPLETQVLKFANNNYSSDISDGTTWLDAGTGDPSTTVVAPGQGFFYFNPAATDRTVTLVGEVTKGNNLTVPIPPGFSLVSSITPQDISLTAANGFTQLLEMQYLTFNSMTQNYDVGLINDGTQWLNSVTGDPADAHPLVGQGFFIFNPDSVAHNWVRNFNP